MKKLLLLGGDALLLPVIKKAKEYGIYTITCDYLPDDDIAHKSSDEYVNFSTTDKEDILEWAETKHIDGVLTFTDSGALTAAYIAEKIGLPYQCSYKAASILQDKALFRDFLQKHNFNSPHAKGCSTIEDAITPKTTAIMPVHVYGKLCDTVAIQEIADKYGLKVIYDAAHAFGVEVNGKSILTAGDMSTLSFHATKVYNTIEGGALVVQDEQTKKRIDYLKNFGFADEVTVVAPGINSKMDEVRAAYGLLNLKQVDTAIEARHQVAIRYREALQSIKGITFFGDMPGVRHNYSYFPIFIDAEKYGMTRDELYFKMKEQSVLGRRYFYPLISTFSTYRGLKSADPNYLPNAHKMANSVICLPMHHALDENDIDRILKCVSN